MVNLWDSNEGANINQVGSHPLFTGQSRYGQEKWYSDWTWPDEIHRIGGILIGYSQAR